MEYINLEFFTNLEREGKSVIDFCMKMGFIASSYECPECKNPMKLIDRKDHNQDTFIWYCGHKNKVRRSIRNGSWFQDSRLSLITMLKLAYLWVKRTTYAWIAHELKMSQTTVCNWMAFFRRVCVNAIKEQGAFIGGPDEIVEIDARCFSNIKNKQGRETWVFGGVERSSKKCFLEIIQSGEENEIISILQKYVRPGTTIVSDNWKGFDCLESNGYIHQKTSGRTDKNNMLSLWSRLKKIVRTSISNDQFDAYLAEVMWRCLHKENIQGLIISFFKVLTHIYIPPVRDGPTYKLRKTEREKGNCLQSVSDVKLSENRFLPETQSKEVNTDNNHEGITQLKEMNGNNSNEQGESVYDLQIFDNQFMEEIEIPLVLSGDLLSEDEFESENRSKNKRQKTLDSIDKLI